VRLSAPFELAGDHVAIDLPGAKALFTTRRGGVSQGPYASLNLGRWTDDRREDVECNRALVAARVGAVARLAYGRQVHGARVHRVRLAPSEATPPEEADGQATALAGVAPMVLAADCLPIALAGEGAVAMLHAGWRGLAAGVIAEGVGALRELGATGPIHAAVGPGAGVCCYEVGEEVHAAFSEQAAAVRDGRNLDLKAIARLELERAGVTVVHDAELCTLCTDPSLFFSHRRDRGVTGRQAGLAWLT
jgi:YfiH family protein